MYRSRNYFELSSPEKLRSFNQLFLSALTKLNDIPTKQLGLEEIRNLLAQKFHALETIPFVLNILSENKDDDKNSTSKENFKVLAILADIYGNRILSFLPKILSIASSSLKENNPQNHEPLSDALGSVIGYGLGNISVEEGCRYINSVLNSFYILSESSNRYTQIGSAICIAKVIQCSPIECLRVITDQTIQKLVELLKTPRCKAHYQLLECLLSLVLAIEDNIVKLKENTRHLFPVLIDNLTNPDWNVRKISIEVIYTLSFLTKDVILSRKQELLIALNHCRFDKVRNVREIASITISFLKGLPNNSSTNKKEENWIPLSSPSGFQKDRDKKGYMSPEVKSFSNSNYSWDRSQKIENNQRIMYQKDFEKISNPKIARNLEINKKVLDHREKIKDDIEKYLKGSDSLSSFKQELKKDSFFSSDLPIEINKRDQNPIQDTFSKSLAEKKLENNLSGQGDIKELRNLTLFTKQKSFEKTEPSHRRQISEQESYRNKSSLPQHHRGASAVTDLISKVTDLEGTLQVNTAINKVTTPGKKETLGASPTQGFESASLASPGFLADDFAGLHKQLKKISKQQKQLIESVSVFQSQTQNEISFLRNRMEYLENIVQQKLQIDITNPYQQFYPSNFFSLPPNAYSNIYNTTSPASYQNFSSTQNHINNDRPKQFLNLEVSRTKSHESFNRNERESKDELQSPKEPLLDRNIHHIKPKASNTKMEPFKSIIIEKFDDTSFKDKEYEFTKGQSEYNKTHSSRSYQNQEKRIDSRHEQSVWTKVEELLKEEKIGEAYAFCIGQGDDGSLIKLMKKTGVVLHLLSDLVLEEMLLILQNSLSDKIYREIAVEWIEKLIETKDSNWRGVPFLESIITKLTYEKQLTERETRRIEALKDKLGDR